MLHLHFIAAFFVLRENMTVEVMKVYNNDQPFGYQPHRMGGYGQMQPLYQPYQAPQQSQPQQDMQLYCRPVASADEARGVPVDFSGKPMIFPHLNAGRIYVKVFDPGNGSAAFHEFRLVNNEAESPAQPAIAFAPMSDVEQLKQVVFELQNEMRAIKNGKRKNAQEVAANDE